MKKFLKIGFVAVSLGLILNPSYALENIDIKNKIEKEIIDLYENQYKNNFFSEKAYLVINIVSEKNKHGIKENYFYRKDNSCQVNLTFDENGNGSKLSKNNLSEFKLNNNQMKIYREFMALHEHAHCEFSNIKNPLNYHELKHVDSCFTGNSPGLLRKNFL